LPDTSAKIDPFLKRVAAAGLTAGLFITLLVIPLGIACVFGFGGWLLGLLVTEKSQLRALQATLDSERDRTTALNESMKRAWEEENAAWNREYRKRASYRQKLGAELQSHQAAVAEADRTSIQLFTGAIKNLHAAKVSYETSKDRFDKAMVDLAKESAKLQLDSYLDAYLIRDAKIQRLSIAAISSLSSFGIETALDAANIENVKIPGIGPVLTQRIVEWRNSLTKSFKPKPGIQESNRVALEQRHFPLLKQHISVLLAGPKHLRLILKQNESERAKLLPKIKSLRKQFQQAEADLEVMERLLS
jgi:DNA-binding helix-hairpin-helix protein with protein kinase domain